MPDSTETPTPPNSLSTQTFDMREPHVFTWQYIWTFFVRRSKPRSWLFSRHAPTTNQIVHALQTHPSLLGYDFHPLQCSSVASSFKRSICPYPDVADLNTAFAIVDNTILGFNFGYRTIHPFIPPLRAVATHLNCLPEHLDASTVVRRTARFLVRVDNVQMFLTIEFSWFSSGALSVMTCVNPLDCTSGGKSDSFTREPFFDHAELRFFSPSDASRLHALAQQCSDDCELDPCLLFPQQEHLFIRIRQPSFKCTSDDPPLAPHRLNLPEPNRSHFFVYPTKPSSLKKTFREELSNQRAQSNGDFVTRFLSSPSSSSSCDTVLELSSTPSGDSSYASSLSIVASTISGEKLRSGGRSCEIRESSHFHDLPSAWRYYHSVISNASRRGILMSSMGHTSYVPAHNERHLYGRYGQYRFMHTDFQARTLVQHLCHHLGLFIQHPAVSSRFISHPTQSKREEALLNHNQCQLPSQGSKRVHSDSHHGNIEGVFPRVTKRPRTGYDPMYISGILAPICTDGETDVPNRSPAEITEVMSFSSGEPSTTNGGSESRDELQHEGIKTEAMKHDFDKVPCESKWSNMVWTCDRCGAKIRGKRGNLNRHIASKHDNIRAFICTEKGCERRFQTRLNLVRHVTAVHTGRPFQCDLCSRAFKSEDDRASHYRTAHSSQNNKRLSCSICGGCFGRRSTLTRHIENVHKVALKEGDLTLTGE